MKLTDQELASLNDKLETIYGHNLTILWSPTYWDTLRLGIAAGLVRENVSEVGGQRRKRYTYVPKEITNMLEGKFNA